MVVFLEHFSLAFDQQLAAFVGGHFC